jgi:translation initiation factor 3 subunit C
MTSRFFQASDSEESDSDEQELYSDGDEEEAKPAGSDAESDDSDEDSDDMDSDDSDDSSSDGVGGASRFLKADKDDDSDAGSEEGPVVAMRSQKDKRNEEAEAVIRTIENAVKINDWAVTLAEFDKLNRLVPGWVKSIDGRNPKSYSACAVLRRCLLTVPSQDRVGPGDTVERSLREAEDGRQEDQRDQPARPEQRPPEGPEARQGGAVQPRCREVPS